MRNIPLPPYPLTTDQSQPWRYLIQNFCFECSFDFQFLTTSPQLLPCRTQMERVFEAIDPALIHERYGGTFTGEYSIDHMIDLKKDAQKAALVDSLLGGRSPQT